MLKDIPSLILKHTVVSRRHLTPELAIRVIDSSCPLWSASEDQLPFKDPFWAFYWPGGQATARYILDNGNIVQGRRVLDIGCGCGAGSIAAAQMKAKVVLANDIDIFATTASKINAELNKTNILTSTDNFIGKDCIDFDTILIGDMFYDEEFSNMLFDWLKMLRRKDKTILIGDPGRHGMTTKMREEISLLATYRLQEDTCIENRGFSDTRLWVMK